MTGPQKRETFSSPDRPREHHLAVAVLTSALVLGIALLLSTAVVLAVVWQPVVLPPAQTREMISYVIPLPLDYVLSLCIPALATFVGARLRPSSWLGVAAVPPILIVALLVLAVTSEGAPQEVNTSSLLVLPIGSMLGAWLGRKTAAR